MLETAEFKHLQEQERRNKKLIEHYWDELWNKRNFAILDEVLTPDIIYYGARESKKGLDEYKSMCRIYASAFKKTQVEILEMMASEDKVMSRVLFTCTHTGEMAGIPARGNEVKIQAFTMFRIEHAHIVEEWEMFDELGMLQQMGMELKMKESV